MIRGTVNQVPDSTAGVKVGTLIAVMVPEGENWQDVMIPTTGSESAPAQPDTVASKSEPVGAPKSQKIQFVDFFKLTPAFSN